MTAAPWANRIVGMGEERPDQLLANPANWRVHPRNQQDALAGALDTVGWVQQVMVNRRTGYVVDGHARVALALSRGEATVPVLYVDLAPAEEKIVLATLDPIAAMAGTDHQLLDDLIGEVSVDDEALRRLLGDLVSTGPKQGLIDPDDLSEPGAPFVKLGQTWLLGEHRVRCGDATNGSDVVALFGDVLADIVWTDPPYGIDYVGGSHQFSPEERRARGGKEIANDSSGFTRDLVAAGLRLAPLRAGGAFYVASPSGGMGYVFCQALEEIGFQLRQQIVWVKDVFVMGRQDYHWRHEVVLYGWRDGAAHHWAGGRDQDTVWEIARPKRSKEHPTMKPVELVARALANSSHRGDIVYDPFVGSGTTIIAAEQQGRRCYAMDLDPRYAQVAIERWQAFTGQQAVLG